MPEAKNRMAADKGGDIAARLTGNEFDTLVSALGAQGQVMAPRRFASRGRFSGTDLIRYDKVSSANEIELQAKSDFSPKEVLFPVNETLLVLDGQQATEPAEDERPIYLFLRACDIHGIDRLDGIFLHNGPEPDPYYLRRRRRIRFILIECTRSFENCFCVAMGTSRADNYAMAVRWEGDGAEVLIRDSEIGHLLSSTAQPSDYAPTFVTKDDAPVRLPNPNKLTTAIREKDLFGHEMWKDYAQRCIACGRCNTHCVSCSCFTTFDVTDTDSAGRVQRRRAWASCHIDRFTNIAGGHVFREDYGSRMRFKTMHKIYDYHLRFGRHMCVGCGRCDDHCPEYISFSTCINRVNEVVNED